MALKREFTESPSPDDSIFLAALPASETDSTATGSTSELGCRVSRRLGTVWRGEAPRQSRPRAATTPRVSRISKLRVRRGSAARAVESADSGIGSNPDFSFIIDPKFIIESSSPTFEPNPTGHDSDSDSEDGYSLFERRHGFNNPGDGDDINCLNCFAAYGAVEPWSVDMRLTLLWCLAYEARFRRRGPALELWLAIIEGGRERVDWGMWEDGDENWLRTMIIQNRMANRFRVGAAKLSAEDWMAARDALTRRLKRPEPANFFAVPGPVNSLSIQHRILRIAWCTVTDGLPTVGAPRAHDHVDIMKSIDSWTYFTRPFRPSQWRWFRTAFGRGSYIPRQLSEIDRSGPSHRAYEPAIWPAIIWVAFQVQTRHGSVSSEAKNIEHLLTIIRSNAEEHLGLWSWDDADEQMLRQNLFSPNDPGPSWIDHCPASWRDYLLLLDPNDWTNLEALTRKSSRIGRVPPDYDLAIRIGALVLWTSSNAVSDRPDFDALLSLEMFLPSNPALNNHGFLRCFLERRVPVRTNHYELNLGSETVDWHQPRLWLDRNRARLRSSVLHEPDTTSFVDVAENLYLVFHVAPALPLRFMSSVFSSLLRKSAGDEQLERFRSCINIWKTWDTTTCLVNFRSVLATTLEFSKFIEHQDLPMSLINVVIHTDIRCICAQFADILRDPIAYQGFLENRDDCAQKLLDLLQDLLDYPLLDARIRPVILKALLKLSIKANRHPRCFALSDRLQLAEHPTAAGSFGDVWKGKIHGATVSVKIMRVYQEADVEALLQEFYHEALIWRQLSHPNLLPFFGAYYLEGTKSRLCLVSPWMENGDITRYLKANPAGINRLTLTLDVALGLDHLHSLKLVHGDLKAINVLVARSGRAVLADFGLSSVTDSKILQSASTSKAGGTMRWQAPELFTGEKNSFSSDIYALSCVFYEILTGSLPFYDLPTDVAVMYQVMHGQRPKRTSVIEDSVWNLMTECWTADPQERPSIEQIVFRLRDRPIGAVPTDTASDWSPWYTSKFRSSMEEHTLFLSCGSIDDWLQFTQSETATGLDHPGQSFLRDLLYILRPHSDS